MSFWEGTESTSPLLLVFEKRTWSHTDLEWTKETKKVPQIKSSVYVDVFFFFFQSQLKSEFWEKHLKRWKRLSKEGSITSPSWLLYELQTLHVHHAAVLGVKQKTWENCWGPYLCPFSLGVFVNTRLVLTHICKFLETEGPLNSWCQSKKKKSQ